LAGAGGMLPDSVGANVAVTSTATARRKVAGAACSPQPGATMSTAPSRANSNAPIQAYWLSQSSRLAP
jgi:hypothetical protein